MRHALRILVLVLTFATAARPALPAGIEEPEKLGTGESVLFVAGTNDIHGGFEPSDRKGEVLGGFQWLAGYMAALRAHAEKQYGDRSAVILLDGGDAAQGTLLSNYSEGMLAIRLMNEVGYTAAVPGNHAYDFGPVGWTVDVVPAGERGDPLGALKKVLGAATFPFLGANVTTKGGAPLKELPPFVLQELPGRRRVAIIGLENPMTPVTTVAENVAGLEFSEGVSELKQLVDELRSSGKADVFVLVMHEGDGASDSMRALLRKLPKRADGEPLVDAVIAGHSHYVNDSESAGIPYIQSSANGRMFGVMRLVLKKGRDGRLSVLRDRTAKKAGIKILPKKGRFLGEPVNADPRVEKLLAAARDEVNPIASRHLCTAPEAISYEGGRTADSQMGNLLADMMRAAGGTDVAVINSGDVRNGMPKGQLTYEDLFEAVPKNILMVTVSKTPVENLVKNVQRSTISCGRRGALQFSGMAVEFKRDCSEGDAHGGEDPNAELVRIRTTDGKVLYEKKNGKETFARPISMVTSDFMMSGGAGYKHFKGLPIAKSVPLRDAVADELVKLKKLDPASYAVGRYKNLLGN